MPTLIERPSACGARERGHGPPKASPRCAGYVALNAVKFWAGAAEPLAKQKNACVRLLELVIAIARAVRVQTTSTSTARAAPRAR